jgi:Domain of unknown function (DUF4062)
MISSTARDLPEHRKEVLDACLRMGMFPMMMEHLPASDTEAIMASLRLVGDADIYIGVFAHRYGYVPQENNPQQLSITEMEYNRAVERGIPRLVFLMDKAHPITADAVERGEGASKLVNLKKRIETESVVNYFKSPADLRAHVINSLVQYREKFYYGDDIHLGRSEPGVGKPKTPSKSRELMRVFVASPRDVWDERSRMPKVVESLNRTLGRMANIVVELWRWEADAPPAAGEPQALINPELDQADVVLVIFWNRFGLKTQGGTTGTESEVMRSLERWRQASRPQVMMYFCQRPALLDIEGLEQRAGVINFRNRVESLGLALAAEYVDVEEFEWRVRDDLFLTLSRMLNR